jgi:hypothetical protein
VWDQGLVDRVPENAPLYKVENARKAFAFGLRSFSDFQSQFGQKSSATQFFGRVFPMPQ